MTNFHDLKLKSYDEISVNNAVNLLATMLYHYSKSFDFDNASYADARTIALGILMEAKELCEDEGCPQAGTVHVCIPKGEPVVDRDDAGNPIPSEVSARYVQQFGRGRRPCMGCGVIPKDELGCATVGCSESLNTPFGPRISSRENEQRGRSFGFVSPEQGAEVNRKFLDKDKK